MSELAIRNYQKMQEPKAGSNILSGPVKPIEPPKADSSESESESEESDDDGDGNSMDCVA